MLVLYDKLHLLHGDNNMFMIRPETKDRTMTREQWLATYSACRAMFKSGVPTAKKITVIKLINELVYYAMISRRDVEAYPITTARWAIKHNLNASKESCEKIRLQGWE